MDTSTTKDAGSNLTAIAEYTETARGLAELRQRHQGVVYDVTVPKEMKAAKEARAELRTLRTDLEKKRVEIKAPAWERCKQIDEEAKRLTIEIRALEEPIDTQIKAEEARKQAEELARLEAERQRVEGIARAIEEIRNVPGGLYGKPAVIVEGQLAKLRAQTLDPEFYAERFREADDALAATIARVEQQLAAQREQEAEQKRIAAERAELERVRAENERLQREADERRRADEERAAAERAEAERKEREAREAEERRVATIRQKINEISFVPPIANHPAGDIDLFIADRVKEDPRDADNTFGFAEFQGAACDAFDDALRHLHDMRREAVRRELEAYEESERRAEQERQLAAERERQADEQNRLDEERAKLERDRKAAAEKAERERLANLGLREAAQAVVDHFAADIANGRAPKVIADLATVLDNQESARTVNRGKRRASA